MLVPRKLAACAAALLVSLAACSGPDDQNSPDSAEDAAARDTADTGASEDTDPVDTVDATDASPSPDSRVVDAADSGEQTNDDVTGRELAKADTGDPPNGDALPGEPMCMSDKQCPGNAVCVHKRCRYYRFVQIKDVTRQKSSSAQTACSENASGADLFQLELRDPFGKVEGNAKAVAAQLESSANKKVSTVFDGNSNSLQRQTNGALCPSEGFAPDSVVSLGCDGTLAVVFTDGAGNILNLGGGQQLVVHEYGDQCCQQGCPEEYWEVRVCTARSPHEIQGKKPDMMGNFPTCNTQVLAVGHGEDKATIKLPTP